MKTIGLTIINHIFVLVGCLSARWAERSSRPGDVTVTENSSYCRGGSETMQQQVFQQVLGSINETNIHQSKSRNGTQGNHDQISGNDRSIVLRMTTR